MNSNPDSEFNFTPNELRMLLTGCLDSILFTARLFFKTRDQQQFIVNLHHLILCHVLDEVFAGRIKRLIINIPPGYTKTELAVIFFIIKGLLLNVRAKFLHTSYSSDLALVNSGVIKEVIQTPLFQALRPMKLRTDTKAKARWYTEHGGGMMAAASGGQVTGFRAGRMDKDQFTGALIIDDPINPEDALSKPIREKVNRTFNTTVKSRLATEDVPIIVIMQRVHEDDLTGYLLGGGSNEMWHHLVIPAYIVENKPAYPAKYKCGIEIPYEMPRGPAREYKHNYDELKTLKKSNIFVWSSQYQQNPTATDSNVLRREWFPTYESFDPIANTVTLLDGTQVQLEYKSSYSDTAMKTAERNDHSVHQYWAKGDDGRIYLIDRVRGKWDSVDLEKIYVRYLKRLVFKQGTNHMGPRKIGVEDKASGTGLIQSINRKIGTVYKNEDGVEVDLTGLPKITGIQRDKDKGSRCLSAAPEIEKGLVVLPENAPYLEEMLDEVCGFNLAMTHKWDDQLDPMLDAVHDMLISDPIIDYSQVVGM
jgi:predicted phage terminase large subunit-like protein